MPEKIEHSYKRIRFGHFLVSDGLRHKNSACEKCVFHTGIHRADCPFREDKNAEIRKEGNSREDKKDAKGLLKETV